MSLRVDSPCCDDNESIISESSVFSRVSGGDISSDGATILGINDTSSPRTATILTTDIIIEGKTFIIKDESGGAGTNNIMVVSESGENFDGAAYLLITVDYGVVKLYSDSNNLFTY